MDLEPLIGRLPAEIWAERPLLRGAVPIRGLSCDSRSVAVGELFCALPGARADGARFVGDAWARGAAAVLVEGAADVPPGPGPILRARSARRAMALLAAVFHNEPASRLRVIGITGTDGKTSTAWFVRQILVAQGRRAVALGTLGIKSDAADTQAWGASPAPAADPSRTWSPTTPEAPVWQATLARLEREGVQDVVAEISSHALSQDRIHGTQFAVVALTHVTADHLDFHGSLDAYRAAKAKLFDPAERGGPLERRPVEEVLNLADELGRRLARGPADAWTYGRDPEARVRLRDATACGDGITLDVTIDGRPLALATGLLGRFHIENLLTATAIAGALGVTPEAIRAAVAALEPVPGRFEPIREGQAFSVIVDYAHTADGLTKLLGAAREITRGRVITVFGCGGDRDATKREPMGEVAGSLADIAIVTTDNPRSEPPAEIAAAVARGVARGAAAAETVLDRRRAIARGIALARPGDTLVLAGRGSESLQVFRDRVVPFDDRTVARELLRALGAPAADPWSLGEIARMTDAVVAGVAPEDWQTLAPRVAAGVALDSRQVGGGQVFVALAGAKVDGHDFIAPAFEAGAAAAVVRRGWWDGRKAAHARGIHLLVGDPLAALQAWAAELRRRIDPRVLAITGSAGKTTTKEMAHALLGEAGTIATLGNRNNEIGLPWTLLQLRPGTRAAVVELGANHPGEIARLTQLARPDVALITGVGRAHVGLFGSLEAVREAKLEIVQGLPPHGAVVIPDDDPELEARLRERWPGRIVRFGWSERADVRATALTCRLDGSRLEIAGLARPLELRVLGEAGARGALAALAAVRALAGEEPDATRLESVRPYPGRLDPILHAGVCWILDVYNASPESVLHALRFFLAAPLPGRRVFVFGGMRELGEAGPALHREAGHAAGGCDAGVFIGEAAREAASAAQRAGMKPVVACDEIRDAVRFLREYLRPGDGVLLKGARAAGLERVAQAMGIVPEGYGEGRL